MNGYVVINSNIRERMDHPESLGKPPTAGCFGNLREQSLASLIDTTRASLTGNRAFHLMSGNNHELWAKTGHRLPFHFLSLGRRHNSLRNFKHRLENTYLIVKGTVKA